MRWDVAQDGHHIVMKNKFNEYTEPAREILCTHDINPYKDRANLSFSPNWCHTIEYARLTLTRLETVKDLDQDDVKRVLVDLAKWHYRCGGGAASDPAVSDLEDA